MPITPQMGSKLHAETHLRIRIELEGYQEFETEITSWEIDDYYIEFNLDDLPAFQSAGELTARRTDPDHTVTFSLEGSQPGLEELKSCQAMASMNE
jgi:hypothetical protein